MDSISSNTFTAFQLNNWLIALSPQSEVVDLKNVHPEMNNIFIGKQRRVARLLALVRIQQVLLTLCDSNSSMCGWLFLCCTYFEAYLCVIEYAKSILN